MCEGGPPWTPWASAMCCIAEARSVSEARFCMGEVRFCMSEAHGDRGVPLSLYTSRLQFWKYLKRNQTYALGCSCAIDKIQLYWNILCPNVRSYQLHAKSSARERVLFLNITPRWSLQYSVELESMHENVKERMQNILRKFRGVILIVEKYLFSSVESWIG